MLLPVFHAAGTTSFTANNVPASPNLTPGLPTRTNGDLLLLFTWSRSISGTCATPSGWSLLTGFPVSSGTASGGRLYVFGLIVDGSESAPTAAWSGLTSGTSGDATGSVILSYSNVRVRFGAGSSQDGTITSSDQAASTTTVTVPSITTAIQNSIAIGFYLKLLETGGTWTQPSGWNERLDTNTSSGTGHQVGIADLVFAAAGATGSTTAAPSVTTSSRALGVTLAIGRQITLTQPGINHQNPGIF